MSNRIIIRPADQNVDFKILIKMSILINKIIDKLRAKTGIMFTTFIEDNFNEQTPAQKCNHVFVILNRSTVECVKCRSLYALTHKKDGK